MFDDRTRPKVSLRGRSRQEGRQETLQRALEPEGWRGGADQANLADDRIKS